ncbi:hypothetical protein EZS27_044491, partial [termite gut metagenome]
VPSVYSNPFSESDKLLCFCSLMKFMISSIKIPYFVWHCSRLVYFAYCCSVHIAHKRTSGYVIEINALWYNALKFVVDMSRESGNISLADKLDAQAEITGKNVVFVVLFVVELMSGIFQTVEKTVPRCG